MGQQSMIRLFSGVLIRQKGPALEQLLLHNRCEGMHRKIPVLGLAPVEGNEADALKQLGFGNS